MSVVRRKNPVKRLKQTTLESFRDFLQDFAETLALLLDLEITIADENFVRIVGTGVFKDKLFQQLPSGSVYRSSIILSKPYMVRRAVMSNDCKCCELNGKCTVMAEVCAPILQNDKVVGVIGLVALDNSQKGLLLRRSIEYFNAILRLAEVIRTVLEFGKVPYKCETLNISGETTFDSILGASDKLRQAIEVAKKAAQSDANILITGESGTGKELFARAIHSASHRRQYIFEPINCCAIPDALLESELFGYEEGAFTGAKGGGKIGKFQIADKGTILLDEIGDMSIAQQSKLLRVLEEKSVVKLGGTKHYLADTRFIAATNQDLRKLIKLGTFREDLYYRLNVISIHVPALRDRIQDVDIYTKIFLDRYSQLYKKSIKSIEPKLLNRFYEYSWPGNVREFKNLIEFGIILEDESTLRNRTVISKFEQIEAMNISEIVPVSLSEKMKDVERKMVREAVNQFSVGGVNLEETAKHLGISRATLYRKLHN